MDRLRNYSLFAVVALVVMGIVAVVASFMGWWTLTLVLTYGALLITVSTVFVAARYLARLSRTQEKKSRATTQGIVDLLEDTRRIHLESEERRRHFNDSAHAALADFKKSTHEGLADFKKSTHESLADFQKSTHKGLAGLENTMKDEISELGQRMDEFDTALQETSRLKGRDITRAVRESTAQVESLLQLYSRFPANTLPMPLTGGFAIDAQALGHLLTLVDERRPRTILELGSGTSTIWLGYLCRSIGAELVTLDHLEEYLDLTCEAVERHGLDSEVDCRLAPLEELQLDGETFQWYAPSALADLDTIDLVLVDGPPAATGPKARYPSLPMIIDRLAPSATVILDDAHRDDEANIVAAWEEAFPSFRRIETGTSRLAVLQRHSDT